MKTWMTWINLLFMYYIFHENKEKDIVRSMKNLSANEP